MTLGDAAFDYWRSGLSWAPASASREYEMLKDYVLPLLGHLEVERITREHVQALKCILRAQGLDDFTYRGTVAALTGVLLMFAPTAVA